MREHLGETFSKRERFGLVSPRLGLVEWILIYRLELVVVTVWVRERKTCLDFVIESEKALRMTCGKLCFL